jgi:hypothetical protein
MLVPTMPAPTTAIRGLPVDDVIGRAFGDSLRVRRLGEVMRRSDEAAELHFTC